MQYLLWLVASNKRVKKGLINTFDSSQWQWKRYILFAVSKNQVQSSHMPFVSPVLLAGWLSVCRPIVPLVVLLHNNNWLEEKWISLQKDHLLLLICCYLQFFLFNFNSYLSWLLVTCDVRLYIFYSHWDLGHWHYGFPFCRSQHRVENRVLESGKHENNARLSGEFVNFAAQPALPR